ncbi:MAG: PASTA domain-containing protein, partial [Streptomycetales bacterium]
PDLSGLTVAQARQQLRSSDLTLRRGPLAYSETVPAGDIVATDPQAGDQVLRDGTLTAVVSKGKERYPMPPVVGISEQQARTALTGGHLRVGEVTGAYSGRVDEGDVISASQDEGTQLRPDTPVDLVVSKGAPPISVPNVVGAAPADAVAALEATGLTGQVVGEAYSDTVPAGQVASQDPASGQAVAPGATVALTVSKGPELVVVPNVVGMPVEEAQATLEGVGFAVRVLPSLPGGDQNVTAQYPPAGSQQAKGATITLSVY